MPAVPHRPENAVASLESPAITHNIWFELQFRTTLSWCLIFIQSQLTHSDFPEIGELVNWFNEPSSWRVEDSHIIVRADAQTDFLRVTGYGYVRDNAHIYGETLDPDFDLTVRISGEYTEQYDQAGVAVRMDERHWIKTGVELFDGRLRFSTVVTVDNSSWMFADLPEDFTTLNLSLARRGGAMEISYSTDTNKLALASVVYVQPRTEALAGVMCASPQGEGFAASFFDFELRAC